MAARHVPAAERDRIALEQQGAATRIFRFKVPNPINTFKEVFKKEVPQQCKPYSSYLCHARVNRVCDVFATSRPVIGLYEPSRNSVEVV